MKRVEETREVRAEHATDTISAWLLGFERVMVGTKDEKRETRAELESHLRDRARDLMLAGLNADEAARRAIDELGEAAEIAGSYRATRVETQRRKAMQVAAIGLAAGAAVVSVAAMFQGAGARPMVPEQKVSQTELLPMVRPTVVVSSSNELTSANVATIEVAEPNALATGDAVSLRLAKTQDGSVVLRAAKFEVKSGPTEPLALEDYEAPIVESELLSKTTVTVKWQGARVVDALKAIAESSGGKVRVPWERVSAMTDLGVENLIESRDWKNAALEQVLEELNEGLPESGRIVVRDRGEYLEMGPERTFDARETRFVAYRVAGVLEKAYACEAAESDRASALKQTLTAMVYRDDWVDNGGNIAEMHYAGGTLFVKAPERHHHMVAWILRKLSAE